MYKLREARLREFYTIDMDNTTTKFGLSKTPNTRSHGDSLVDQSFESFKTKEIRDSESPTRYVPNVFNPLHLSNNFLFFYRDTKFGIMSPNTGGWNIITSKETSDDGKTHTTQSLATTEGKKKIAGGQTAFTGKNEQVSSDRYDGDDKNYVHSTGDSSNTVLSEVSVTGDANNKRTETKSSSTTSSSHFVTTKKSTANDDIDNYFDGAIKNIENLSSNQSRNTDQSRNSVQSRNTEQQQRTSTTEQYGSQQNNENIYANVNTNTNQKNVSQQNTSSTSTSTTATGTTKLSSDPKRVEEAFRLAQMPGRVISVDVVLVNPTTKMITETKQLEDGTTVTTRQYEKLSESDVTSNERNVDVHRINRNNTRDSVNRTSTTTTTTSREERENRNRMDQQNNENRRQSSKKDEILETIVLKQNQNQINRNDYDQVDRRSSTDYITNKEFHIDDYNNSHSVKKDLNQQYRTEKVHNIDNRRPNDNNDRRASNTTTITTTRIDDHKNQDEQLRRQHPNQDSTNKRITVEVNAAHKAFASSLRCVSPDRESRKSTRSSSSPDKSFRSSRRTLSRETINSETSRISSATVTRSRTDLSKNLDYMRPTITSERKTTTYTDDYRKPVRKESTDITEDIKTSRNTSTIVLSEDTVDKAIIRDTSPTKFGRSVSPKKVPQNTPNLTPRGPSPNKVVRESSPVKKPLDDNITPKITSQSPSPTKPVSDDTTPRYTKKPSTDDIRGISPTKPTSLRDISPEKDFLRRSTEDNITRTTTRSSPSPVRLLRDVSPNKTVSLEDIMDTPYKSRSPSPNKVSRGSTPVRNTYTSVDNTENVSISSIIDIKKIVNENIKQEENVKKHRKSHIVTDLDSEEVTLVDSEDSIDDDVQLRTTKITVEKKNTSDDFIQNEKNASNTLKRKDTTEDFTKDTNSRKSSMADVRKTSTTDVRNATTIDNRRTSTTDVRKTSTTDVRKNSVQNKEDNVMRRNSSFRTEKNVDTTQKDKAPFKRSETFDERCRKILGISDKTTMDEKVEKNITSILGNIENTTTTTSSTNKTNEIREKRKQIEQEIKEFERKSSKDVIVDTRNLKDNIKSTSPTRSPDRKSSSPLKKNSQIDIDVKRSSTDVTTIKNERKISASSPARSPDRKTVSSPINKSPESDNIDRNTVITTTTVKTTINDRRAQPDSPSHSPDRKSPSSTTRRIIDSETIELVTSDKKTRKISNDVGTSDKFVPYDKKGPSASPTRSPDRRTSSITRKFIDTEREDTEIVENKSRRTSKDITSSTTAVTDRRTTDRKSPTSSPTRKPSPNKYNEPISRTPSDSFRTSPTKKSPETPQKRTSVTEIEIKINTDSLVKDDKTSTLRTTRKQNSTDNITRTASPTKKTVTEKKTVTSTVERTIPKIKTTDYNVEITQSAVNDKKSTTTKTNTTNSNHITTAKINIAPVITRDAPKFVKNTRNVTETRAAKTTNKNKSNTKDIPSDTENDQDSDVEYVEIVETTTSTRTNNKKNAVIDRKDSAPVYRTTKKDKENHKMTRSTSDNLIKTNTIERKKSKTEIEKGSTNTSTTSTPTKSVPKENSRTTKCVTTKTINLSAKPTPTICSDDLDNIIIDIQLAKSSREPTPNKMIPIPASPEDEDFGKPRYPDVVHEPDDEAPKRKPKVNNIPIFEEETSSYVGVQISEVHDERSERASSTERIVRLSEIDRVAEDDESLLSVTEKVSKFVSEADKLKKTQRTTPASPKFERPDLNTIDEDLRSDKCLLSVSDKVSEFITTAEEVKKIKTSAPVNDCHSSVTDKVTKFSNTTDETTKIRSTSTTKPQRPQFEVDDDLREDECLLSVSDKVNKFIHTAEKLSTSTPQKSPEMVKNIMRQSPSKSKPEELVRIDDVVDEEEEEDYEEITDEPVPTSPRGTVKDRYVPKEKVVVTPQVTLKSTEAVKKAKALFENKAATPTSSPLPNRRDILSRPSVWEDRRAKAKAQTDVKLTDIGVYKKNDESEIEEVEERNIEFKSNRKNSSNTLMNTSSTTTSETEVVKRKTSNSHEDTKTMEAVTIKKDDLLKSKTPLYMKDQVSSRKDIFEKKISQSKMETSFVDEEQDHVSRRSSSRDENHKPSYMNHTVSSLEHMNRRDSSEHSVRRDSKTVDEEIFERIDSNQTSKFGVELKRTDSERNTITSTTARRKSSSSEIPHIEDIEDLELLEKMLETVVGYEQRRRIRAQIRVVKKMMETNTLTSSTTTTSVKKHEIPKKNATSVRSRNTTVETTTTMSKTSPTRAHIVETTTVRKSSPTRGHVVETTTVRKSGPSHNHTTVESTTTRRTSPTRGHSTIESTTVRKSSPTRTQKSTYETEYNSSFKKQSSKPNMDLNEMDSEVEIRSQNRRSASPAKTNTIVTKRVVESSSSYTAQKPSLNRIIPKESEPKDDKPIWARNNILKKASETTRTFKTTSSSMKKTNTPDVKPKAKDTMKPTDCITSSYGVGPTDENGLPLFGIRALKKKQPAQSVDDYDEDVTSKVSGTYVTETLYSENGSAPVGERQTTHYSSDAKDFDKMDLKRSPAEVRSKLLERENSRKGIISVTKTERIGDNSRVLDGAILDKDTKTKNSKIVRKGSVKELTEKFVHRESSSSITEKSSTHSYPKAGLILRSQSHSSRASTPGERSDSVELDESDIEIRTMESRRDSRDNTSSSRVECVEECQDRCSSKYQTNRMKSTSATNETKSFLNSETKVSNVQDVLNRMRNADNSEFELILFSE